MKIYNFLGLVISFILAFVSFFATSNIFVGAGVLIACITFYFIFIYKKLTNHLSVLKKVHECYLFSNNFLVTLSIKQTLNASFEAVRTSVSDEFFEYLQSIDELNPQEKLLYLNKYFPFHSFQIFVEVILLWIEEGGDILQMSSHVINAIREMQEYASYCQSIDKRKGFEIATLWFFSLIIVIVLKFSLTGSYAEMLKQPIFIASVIGLVLLVLFSIYLFILKVTTLDIRRYENE